MIAIHSELCALQVGWIALKPALAGVRVGDDRSQGLIHLVGDRSRELCKACSLRRPGELGGGLPQRLLRSPLILDIERNAVPLHNRSVLIAQGSALPSVQR